jgi:hypothetical protein
MGMTLNIIDNPGWDFKVDLVAYENNRKDISYTLVENGPDDWIGYKVRNSYLNIADNIKKLSIIMQLFKNVVLYLESGNRMGMEDLAKLVAQVS